MAEREKAFWGVGRTKYQSLKATVGRGLVLGLLSKW